MQHTEHLTPSQELLKELRQVTGLNISKIARESRISRRTINNLIKGATQEPNQRTWHRLLGYYCSIFYIKRDWLPGQGPDYLLPRSLPREDEE